LSARCDGRGFPQFRRSQFRIKVHGATASLLANGAAQELTDFLVLENRGQGFSLEFQIS
jgi:hypothetical protein